MPGTMPRQERRRKRRWWIHCRLQPAMKRGKLALGHKQSPRLSRRGKENLLILASTWPALSKSETEHQPGRSRPLSITAVQRHRIGHSMWTILERAHGLSLTPGVPISLEACQTGRGEANRAKISFNETGRSPLINK